MSDVEFKEDVVVQFGPNKRRSSYTPGNSGIIGLLMRWHLAKNENQASVILFVLSMLFLVASSFQFWMWISGANKPRPTLERVESLLPPHMRPSNINAENN